MQQQNIWHTAKYQDNKNHPKMCANGQILQTLIFTFHLGIYNLKPVALFTNSMKAWTLKMLAAVITMVFTLGVVCHFFRGRESF